LASVSRSTVLRRNLAAVTALTADISIPSRGIRLDSYGGRCKL
jgi:hypothetical protein